MKDNFRTLTSGILTKAASLFAKKDDVYSKSEAASKDDFDSLTTAVKTHAHDYVKRHKVRIPLNVLSEPEILAYGDGKYVAFDRLSENFAAYSENGIDWIKTQLPRELMVESVTYAEGKFVVVPSDDFGKTTCIYSENGIDWFSAETFTGSCDDVVYGNNKFVTIDNSQHSTGTSKSKIYAVYSEDGISWTHALMPETSIVRKLAYGNGKFVALPNYTNYALYSEDGIEWHSTPMTEDRFTWDSIAYVNGRFIALEGQIVAYSEDGINWNTAELPVSGSWYGVAYGNRFVAIERYSSVALYSEDGINWMETTLPCDECSGSVIYADNKFVSVDWREAKIIYSYDGITWHDTYDEFSQNGENISIATETYVDQAIPTSVSQLTNDAGYITAADLPDNPGGGGTSSPAIIDVTELPSEGINEQALYRLLTGSLVINGFVQNTYTCYCVDGLPESGEPATNLDNSEGNVYYNLQDGEAYGYVNDMLSAGLSVPVGWYPGSVLLGQLGYEYKGAIDDISEDPCDGSFRILLSYTYYTFKGEWTKLIFATERFPKFNITWDGEIGDRFALDMSSLGYTGVSLVKVSDDVFTAEQIIGCRYTRSNGYECLIDDSVINMDMTPGSMFVDGGVVIVYSADDANATLGLPAGYVTNGVYFTHDVSGDEVNYTNRFEAPPRINKIDSKYVDLPIDDNTSIATVEYVDAVISNAIGLAIGGSY